MNTVQGHKQAMGTGQPYQPIPACCNGLINMGAPQLAGRCNGSRLKPSALFLDPFARTSSSAVEGGELEQVKDKMESRWGLEDRRKRRNCEL